MSLIFLPCVAGPLANEYGEIWNAADKGASITLSNRNLTASQSGSTAIVRGTISHGTAGKYYFECHCDSASGNSPMVGVTKAGVTAMGYLTPNSWGIQASGAFCFGNGSSKASGVTYAAGDVYQVAMDFAANSIWYGKNGTWILSGNPSTGANPAWTNLSGPVFPTFYSNTTTLNGVTAHFQAGSFVYAAPTGFSPW